MKSSHVIAAIVVIGLAIYIFSKRKVIGTVSVGEGGPVVTTSDGSVSYGTELQGG